MSVWTPKRFWQAAAVTEAPGGFTVTLDGRAVKTPAKAPLVVPTRALAEAIATEWQAQDKVVDPRTMPFTRSANAAIDKVAVQFDEVAELIAAYGASDLICYRAEAPAELVARQAAGWDPLMAWAGAALGAPLVATTGVMHHPQPPESLEALARLVRGLTPFELTAAHDLVGLSGSLVIGLAALHGHATPETLWQLSRIDETWQQELWGVDEEAAAMDDQRRLAFLHAARFHALCQNNPA